MSKELTKQNKQLQKKINTIQRIITCTPEELTVQEMRLADSLLKAFGDAAKKIKEYLVDTIKVKNKKIDGVTISVSSNIRNWDIETSTLKKALKAEGLKSTEFNDYSLKDLPSLLKFYQREREEIV